MPKSSIPKKGSRGFRPRSKAESEVPRVRSWPYDREEGLLGFAGYKAGMTHVILDEGESIPVTILETPPVKIAGLRAYRETPYGTRPVEEIWSENQHEDLSRSINIPENSAGDIDKLLEIEEIDEIRAITHTIPRGASIPKKKPDIMEIPFGISNGLQIETAIDYLGKEIKPEDAHSIGNYIDVSAITKGKGTQGPVKRWGTKLRKRKHKRQGYKRRIGVLGPWNPSRVLSTVPQQGQTGYEQRTEENKLLIATGEDGENVTPDGGFVNYGEVSSYMMIKGSVPGPEKRLVRTRKAIRPKGKEEPEVVYISTESKQ